MWQIISLDHPIRSAIFVYLTILLIIVLFKPNLIYKKNNNKNSNKNSKGPKTLTCMFPVLIVVLSIFSYYIFILLQWWLRPLSKITSGAA